MTLSLHFFSSWTHRPYFLPPWQLDVVIGLVSADGMWREVFQNAFILAFKPSWDPQGSLFITQTIVNNLVTDIEKPTAGRSHDLCITIWSAKAKNSLELQYGWKIASNALRNWNFRAIAITVCLLWLKYLSCTLIYLQYSLPSGHKIFEWINDWIFSNLIHIYKFEYF